MKIKFCIILLLLSLLSYSQVEVRFTNISNEHFKTLKIMVGSKEIVFKNLKKGKSTEEIKLAGIYRYCNAQVITKKDTLLFRPIDFIGETFYQSGKLNLKLKIVTEENGKRYLVFMI